MDRIKKMSRSWVAALVGGLLVTLLLAVAAGCGEEKQQTTETKAVGKGKGKIYVSVTGTGELKAGTGNMGFAVVDLESKKVDMVNLPDAKAPHGITFAGDTKTAANTRGRVALEDPKSVLLGNAEDGSVLVVDLKSKQSTQTVTAPSTAKLATCGMQMGPDGKTYLSSMADGKVYPFDPKANKFAGDAIGGGDATQSVCGIAWTADGKSAYLSNMFNPNDPSMAGYLAKVEWPSGKLIKKIENVTKASTAGSKPMEHQTEVTPDGKFMYVTDGIDGAVVKIDMTTEQIVKTVPVGKEPHAIVFSSDGKTAYITVRHEPVENESSIFVYDVEKDQVIDRIPGIPAPLACGLVLAEI